jgi:hypothetical protein
MVDELANTNTVIDRSATGSTGNEQGEAWGAEGILTVNE